MSGWAAPTRPHDRGRTNSRIWGCGLIAACALAVAAVPASIAAQPPAPSEPPPGDVDDRPPLPPDPVASPVATRYQVPNTDRLIFRGSIDKSGRRIGGIQDDTPLLSEAQGPDEYWAFTEVVQWARKFSAAELEQHAGRGMVRDDLTFASRELLRLKLIRMDGTLTRFRKVRLPKSLVDAWFGVPAEALTELGVAVNAETLAGTTVLYQGWLVPDGEPASRPACVVFTELPAGLVAPEALNEWATVDRWVTFAGYSFKLLAYPGPGADPNDPKAGGWLRAPLLIGVSVTPAPAPTPEIKLNKDLRIFRRIADDARMARGNENWEEVEAWNRVILHARRFTPEQLAAASNRELGFADLFKEIRRDYRLELVHFEGRLVRLRKVEPTQRLTEAGVETLYEGWLIPKDEPANNPICLIISELPPGLEPDPAGKRLMNRWVAFDGYSFKLMHYESQELDQNDKRTWKKAPLLIGRSVITLDDPTDDVAGYWRNYFVPSILGGLLFLIGSALTLSWWFRRGDRKARTEIDAVRQKNPFEG